MSEITEQRKHSVIVDSRGWIYTGSRFISPFSDEAECAIHFTSSAVARQIAAHLTMIEMTAGIHVTKARYEKGITRLFRHAPITGVGAPNTWELGALRRHAREAAARERKENLIPTL
jgi:hypothetical protein